MPGQSIRCDKCQTELDLEVHSISSGMAQSLGRIKARELGWWCPPERNAITYCPKCLEILEGQIFK